MAIDPVSRLEFDGLSLQETKDRAALSLWPGDKQRQAREYIDEKENSPEKQRLRRMLWGTVVGVIGALLFGFYLKQ